MLALVKLTDRLTAVLSELRLVPERLPEPDVAERLESIADTLHAAIAGHVEDLCDAPPANLTGIADANPRTTFDRIAAVLRLRVLVVDWLDSAVLALWVEVARAILLARNLRMLERALMLAHELAHERCRKAPHREVLYLTGCLLLPRSLLASLPPGRPITGHALRAVCPWPVPLDLCELRARMLRRAEEAA